MAEQQLDIILEAIAKNTAAITETEGRINALGGAAQRVSSSTKIADEALGNLTVTTTRHGEALQTTVARTEAASAAERDAARDGTILARAMGEAGAKGAEMTDRFAAAAGVLGSGGPLGVAIGAALIGLGATAELSKKVNETYEEQERASKSLEQAVHAVGGSYEEVNKQYDAFVQQNADAIPNINQAKDVLASFERAGLGTDLSLQALNDTVGLAAIKNEDLSTAGTQVLLMLEGQGRVAKALGIDIKGLKDSDENATTAHKNLEEATKAVTTAQDALTKAQESAKLKEDELSGKRTRSKADLDELQSRHDAVTKATQNLSTAQDREKVAADQVALSQTTAVQVQQQLNEKVGDGARTLTDVQRSQNQLNETWQEFVSVTGPWVTGAFNGLIQVANQLLGGLEAIAVAIQYIIDHADAAFQAASRIPPVTSGAPAGPPVTRGRQMGGPIAPGQSAVVGEGSWETVTALPGGGAYVSPGGSGGGAQGGTTIVQNFYGSVDRATLDAANDELAWRLKYA